MSDLSAADILNDIGSEGEVERACAALTEEILLTQFQLGNQGRSTPGGRPMLNLQFEQWRPKAIARMNAKVVERRDLKQKLKDYRRKVEEERSARLAAQLGEPRQQSEVPSWECFWLTWKQAGDALNKLRAKHESLERVLEAYQEWESDFIERQAIWSIKEDQLPHFTIGLWERLQEIGVARDQALGGASITLPPPKYEDSEEYRTPESPAAETGGIRLRLDNRRASGE